MLHTLKNLSSFVQAIQDLTCPKDVVWIDGSPEQTHALQEEACRTGELIRLNQEKLPNCYLHRSHPLDVARVEARTFICCEQEENAGPTNHWMAPEEMNEKLCKIARGSMAGRTMYIIPYSMGVVGSPFAHYGIEVTDSIYVVLNMLITRVHSQHLRAEMFSLMYRLQEVRHLRLYVSDLDL